MKNLSLVLIAFCFMFCGCAAAIMQEKYDNPHYEDDRVALVSWSPSRRQGAVAASFAQPWANYYTTPQTGPTISEVATAQRMMEKKCQPGRWVMGDEGIQDNGNVSSSSSSDAYVMPLNFGGNQNNPAMVVGSGSGSTTTKRGKQYTWLFHCED